MPYLARATELLMIGANVKSMQGESIGKVEDLILDMRTGAVEYIVVSEDGQTGPGEKLFAVPAAAFAVGPDRKLLVLAISKEELDSAPSFPKDNWPQMADGQWKSDIDEYYLSRGSNPDKSMEGGKLPASF